MLNKIEAQIAIEALKRAYFQGVDGKDWALFGSCFSADAILDVSGATDPAVPPIHAPDAIAKFVREGLEGLTTIHRGFLRTIEFSSETTAHTLWAMEDILLRPKDKMAGQVKSAGLRKVLHGYGHYHEDIKLANGVWQYAKVRLTRIYVETD